MFGLLLFGIVIFLSGLCIGLSINQGFVNDATKFLNNSCVSQFGESSKYDSFIKQDNSIVGIRCNTTVVRSSYNYLFIVDSVVRK